MKYLPTFNQSSQYLFLNIQIIIYFFPLLSDGDTYTIYKNERTRSFKKNDIINHPSNEFR
jgi:hypothetical protein